MERCGYRWGFAGAGLFALCAFGVTVAVLRRNDIRPAALQSHAPAA